jgi:predicted nuclease with TOPRIM domain
LPKWDAPSQIASISVGFGDDDDAYTQIRNNIVYAKDFVQHENGSLIEKLKELEGKIDKLEDRIRQLEGQS